jgi:hypothetical protein
VASQEVDRAVRTTAWSAAGHDQVHAPSCHANLKACGFAPDGWRTARSCERSASLVLTSDDLRHHANC